MKIDDLPSAIDFQSLCLMRAVLSFLPTLSKMTSDDILLYAHQQLCTSLNNLLHYINENGGFTIVGYTLKAQQKDACDANQTIKSEQASIHLAYVFPSNLQILEKAAYKILMFHLPDNYATLSFHEEQDNIVNMQEDNSLSNTNQDDDSQSNMQTQQIRTDTTQPVSL